MYFHRLVEEIKQKCGGLEVQNEDVYMATTFQDFIQMVVRKFRGEDKEELVIEYVSAENQFVEEKRKHKSMYELMVPCGFQSLVLSVFPKLHSCFRSCVSGLWTVSMNMFFTSI